jgi:hypothetical protein
MDKTLLILGAGASKYFCRIFPTGLELIKEINYHFLTEKKLEEIPGQNANYLSALMNDLSSVFPNKIDLFKKIKNKLWEIQLHFEHESLRNKVDKLVSIDNFIADEIKEGRLDRNAKDIIKYCIYYLIKGTEEALFKGEWDCDIKKSWIYELAKRVSTYNDFNLISENLTVITFNYDRIFEKYFAAALNLGPRETSELENSIIHVYGDLGDLKEIPLGLANDEKEKFKEKYERIKLIDDRATRELEIKNADEYKKVHFIGFGYDETNLNLINLARFTSATFHGTAYKCKISQITDLKSKGIDAKNVSCLCYIKEMDI